MFRIDGAALARDLTRIANAVPSEARAALRAASDVAYRSATKTRLFKDRGRGARSLRGSIRKGVNGPLDVFVIASAKHAVYVEEDTRPHAIVARRAPFLVFRVKGKWFRKKRVKHPGTTGKHFMRIARDLAERSLLRSLDASLSRLIRR